MTLEQIKEILAKYNAVPKKSFGQNFLFDAAAIKKLLKRHSFHQTTLC